MNTVNYDLFISYAHEDADLVRRLADALGAHGRKVAFDVVFMAPGGILIHEIEEAIRTSAHGLLVFSPASLASGWVRNEYYLLMQQSINTGQLFVPVLAGTVDPSDLPGFASTRFYMDLRDLSRFDTQVDALIRALGGAP